MTVRDDLKDLSVLVSCYNKKEFLLGFFEGVRPLLINGAEVIIVDDGSTDGSTALLDELNSKLPKKARVFKTANQGAGPARNFALEQACNEIVFFLDIDDLPIHLNLYEVVHQFRKSKADIAIANYKILNKTVEGSMPIYSNQFQIVDMFPNRNEFLNCMGWWRYLYKRQFLMLEHNRIGQAFLSLKNQKFILDDLFWMIHLTSQNIRVLVAPTRIAIYDYFQPDEVGTNWSKYLQQVSLLPSAAVSYWKRCEKLKCDHNTKWARMVTIKTLWGHLALLPVSKYLGSGLKTYIASLQIARESRWSGITLSTIALILSPFKRLKRIFAFYIS